MVFSENVVRDLFRNAQVPCIILHSDSLLLQSTNDAFTRETELSVELQKSSITEILALPNEAQLRIQEAIDTSDPVCLKEIYLNSESASQQNVFDVNIIPFQNDAGKR